MWNAIKPILGQLLTSKKFLATLAAVLVWLVGRFGLEIDDSTLLPVLGSLAAFVIAQGWADSGKEAAKVHAETAQILEGVRAATMSKKSSTRAKSKKA